MKQSIKDIQMKKSLGKILFILFICNLPLLANELATYTLQANKTDVYVKEAVKITFVAQQKDHTNVMFFFVKAKPSADYEIKLLNKKTTELSYHNFTTTFTYILFPLKEKEMLIDFDFTIKEASDEAVAQVYTGSRDNVKWIETDDTKVIIQPLLIKAKKLQKNVDLVGDFTLSAKINKTHINQYESVNLLYKLEGEGYKDDKLQLLKEIDEVTMFTEIHNAYSKLHERGYSIKKDFIYALSAKKSFKIPTISLKAYSPKKQKYYMLTTPSYNIEVDKIDTSTLLDDEESPSSEPIISAETMKQLFIYLIVFIAGYITAIYAPQKHIHKPISQEYEDIKRASSAKDLLNILTQNYHTQEIEQEIKLLEVVIYKNNQEINLNRLKSNILKKIKKEKASQ